MTEVETMEQERATLDVAAVAREVHESLADLGLSKVTRRMERFTFGLSGDRPDRTMPYIEVGTSFGEVRLRLYRNWQPGSQIGAWDILKTEATQNQVSAAVAAGWEAVRARVWRIEMAELEKGEGE